MANASRLSRLFAGAWAMRNLRDLALELAAITVIADSAKEAKERLREEFAAALDLVGADSAKANLDGEDIAKVSLIKPKRVAVINDEQAFARWVSANAPTEIMQSVRDSYKKLFLELLVLDEAGAIHPNTGELMNFVSVVEKSSYISTRFQPEGKAKVLNALAINRLPMMMTLKEISNEV
jgi:hypothetical protein